MCSTVTDESADSHEKMVCVGVVAQPHGVRGHVKLRVYTEDHESFLAYPLYCSAFGQEVMRFDVKGRTPAGFIVSLPGIDSRERAATLKGCKIYTPRSSFPECEDGDYYVEDLKGLDVVRRDGSLYGKALDVVDFGGGPSLRLETVQGREFFFPFNDDVFPEIDVRAGRIIVVPPEELDVDAISDDAS